MEEGISEEEVAENLRKLYEAGRKFKEGKISWQEFVRMNNEAVPGLGERLEESQNQEGRGARAKRK